MSPRRHEMNFDSSRSLLILVKYASHGRASSLRSRRCTSFRGKRRGNLNARNGERKIGRWRGRKRAKIGEMRDGGLEGIARSWKDRVKGVPRWRGGGEVKDGRARVGGWRRKARADNMAADERGKRRLETFFRSRREAVFDRRFALLTTA